MARTPPIPTLTFPDAALALWALVAVLALLLIIRGVRGKKLGDTPSCRRCGYDLSGCTPQSQRCPECGGLLTPKRAIRTGHRRRQWRPVVCGLVMLTIWGAVIGVVRWADAAHFDWTTIKPQWMLLREAKAPDESAHWALRELCLRFDQPSMPRRRQLELVAAALEIQADPSRPWAEGWGQIIEKGRTRGIVTDDQWRAYAINSFQGCGVQLATVIDPGITLLTARLGFARCASHGAIDCDMRLNRLQIDGVDFEVAEPKERWRRASYYANTERHELPLPPPRDPVVVRSDWTLRINAAGLEIPERQVEQVQRIGVRLPRWPPPSQLGPVTSK